MKIILFLLISLTAFSVEARGRRGQSSSGGSTSASQATPLEKYEGPVMPVEKDLVERVNQYRIANGLKALIIDPVLKLRARRHCAWMANNGSMIHSNEGAENIAMGQPTVEHVLQSWKNSSGHNANLLNPNYTKTGMVGYVAPSGSVFWCQQFN